MYGQRSVTRGFVVGVLTAVLLGNSHSEPQEKTLVVHRGHVTTTYSFLLDKLDPATAIQYQLNRPSTPPSSGTELLDQFFSAIYRSDLDWYRSLWEADSFASIDPEHLSNFGTWKSVFDGQVPILLALVQTDQFSLYRFAFSVDGVTPGRVQASIVIAQGGVTLVTNRFADEPVVQFWNDEDLDVTLPATTPNVKR